MPVSLSRLLFGNPLPTAAEVQQRLSNVMALAVFSSDALSSVAYATEEILLVLVTAGAAATPFAIPISLAIAGLLAIVAVSYYQTIHGYPSGGGAYTVAHDNLGIWPGLTAASSLLIAYVLTVAVSVAAGVAAMTSAFPALFPYRVLLCVLAIGLVAWANLRGVRESGTLFAIPTYAFIACVFALLVVGAVRRAVGMPLPAPVSEVWAGTSGLQPVTLFLLLRAFSAGCSALTGVEAISNGIPAFRKPEANNAGKTLIAMAVLLATMFLGITFLTRALHVAPAEGETILSQVGRLVFGSGPAYLVLQVATMLILILAANTSFAGFPRLAAILAHARYMPRQLASLGDRLVYSNGIISLAVMAAALIVVFGGDTHRLIPLYAVGVFLAFTLSQAGMVRHWFKVRGPGWRQKGAMNGLGAITTGVVFSVIIVTKLFQGAWIVLLLIPAGVWVFHSISRHYQSVAEQLSLEGLKPEPWKGLASESTHKVVVPIASLHRGTLAALRFACTLSKDVTAVTVNIEPEVTARIHARWPTWAHGIPLVELASPYRSTIGPLLAFLEEADRRLPDWNPTVVVLPEFVPARWWHHLLHNQTALLIKMILVYQRGKTGKSRVIINVPYYLDR